MAFPTDGFNSIPTVAHVRGTDVDGSDVSVTMNTTVAWEGGAFAMTEDQVQAIFAAAADAVKTYLITTFPGKTISGPFVTYTATKDVTIS